MKIETLEKPRGVDCSRCPKARDAANGNAEVELTCQACGRGYRKITGGRKEIKFFGCPLEQRQQQVEDTLSRHSDLY